ncbi:gram-negative bacteria-binding protein 3-like [Musca vetustissima]|uniref:gram-negative bacteria-binding protein 3-like n=1 Tax=Musca vetustissima TaxID=27455 RepID=UPI002AB76087|nr:gram-negative bacteria-binding protein 3-like [Musca vetustissima]
MAKIIYFLLAMLCYGVVMAIPSTLPQDCEGWIKVEVNESEWSGCNKSIITVNGIPTTSCAGELIFNEDFDGDTLDPKKWTAQNRFPSSPTNEFNIYLDDVKDVLQLKNGLVRIKPKLTVEHLKMIDTEGATLDLGPHGTSPRHRGECSFTPEGLNKIPPYISAHFTTKYKFSFKYGRIEVRAKMPQAMWVYPQLWLHSTYYDLGQIRIAQARNDGSNTDLITGLVLHDHPDLHSLFLCVNRTRGNLFDDFHIYEMLWTPDVITFSLDNVEYCRHEVNSEAEAFHNLNSWSKLYDRHVLEFWGKWAPFDQEIYLLVGEEIGGLREFHDGYWSQEKPRQNTDARAMFTFGNALRNNSKWMDRAAFEIDYIKVYAV